MNSEANLDPAEIAKFEQLSARWWDQNSEFKPLHDINPLRLGFIDRLCPLSGNRVLDVGCGGGILSESMAAKGAKTTGIDMGAGPLEVARLHLLESGLEVDYRQIPVEQLAAQEPGTYDAVACMEMLEHVPDPASVVQACAELTKPGGMLFFSTINRNPKSWLFAIVGAEYLLRMLPHGTHDYAKFIRPSELGRWIRASGLIIQEMAGMTYNPLTQSYRLEAGNLDVNYLVAARKPG